MMRLDLLSSTNLSHVKDRLLSAGQGVVLNAPDEPEVPLSLLKGGLFLSES